jgi:hypothetical protein
MTSDWWLLQPIPEILINDDDPTYNRVENEKRNETTHEMGGQ